MAMPHLIEIKNGEKATGTFSAEEMIGRLDKLRRHMAEAAVDTVLFTSYHTITYYGDFLYCAFGRNYALVVDRDRAVSLSANIDGGQPWRRIFGDNLVYTDWQRDNYFRGLQHLIRDGATVGIEFDHVNLRDRAKLEAALPAFIQPPLMG